MRCTQALQEVRRKTVKRKIEAWNFERVADGFETTREWRWDRLSRWPLIRTSGDNRRAGVADEGCLEHAAPTIDRAAATPHHGLGAWITLYGLDMNFVRFA